MSSLALAEQMNPNQVWRTTAPALATATVPVNELCHSVEGRAYYTKDARPFLVRRAVPADAYTVVANINAVCAEGIYMATEQYTPTPQWEQVLHWPDEYPHLLLLVAEMDRQVVGHCRVFPDEFGQKARHVGDLGIEIIRPFREIGIGTALMECAIEWTSTQGLKKLTVSTFSTNQRAINLFNKMGFVTTGIRCKQCKIGSEYVDEMLMERLL